MDSLRVFRKHIPQSLRQHLLVELTKEYLSEYVGDFRYVAGAEVTKPTLKRMNGVLLFLDIAGFTALAQRLDVENLKNHINEYFSKMLDIIARSGGDVLKFAGDALLVCWKVHPFSGSQNEIALPAPNDSSPKANIYRNHQNLNEFEAVQRAVSCAIEVCTSCSEFEIEQDENDTQNKGIIQDCLNVRAGISYGAMAGIDIGCSDRWEYFFVGDPVREVAAAEMIADKGEVVMTTKLHALYHPTTESSLTCDCKHIVEKNMYCISSSSEQFNNRGIIAPPAPMFASSPSRRNSQSRRNSRDDMLNSPNISRRGSRIRKSSMDDRTMQGQLLFALQQQAITNDAEDIIREIDLIYHRLQSVIENIYSNNIIGSNGGSKISFSNERFKAFGITPFLSSVDNCRNHFLAWILTSLVDEVVRHVHDVARLDYRFTSVQERRLIFEALLIRPVQSQQGQQQSALYRRQSSWTNGAVQVVPFEAITSVNLDTLGNAADDLLDRLFDSPTKEKGSASPQPPRNNGNNNSSTSRRPSRALLEGASTGELGMNIDAELRTITLIFIKIEGIRWQLLSEDINIKSASSLMGSARSINDIFGFLNVTEIENIADEVLLQQAQRCYEVLYQHISQAGGQIRQFIVDDKGTVCIATFGLRGAVNADNAAAATSCAKNITNNLQLLGLSSGIGITTGKAYCGFVGSNNRHEYAVMGSSTNLAARLMSQTSMLRTAIICDEETVTRDRSHTYTSLGEITAKGYTKPVSIYQPKVMKDEIESGLPSMHSMRSLVPGGTTSMTSMYSLNSASLYYGKSGNNSPMAGSNGNRVPNNSIASSSLCIPNMFIQSASNTADNSPVRQQLQQQQQRRRSSLDKVKDFQITTKLQQHRQSQQQQKKAVVIVTRYIFPCLLYRFHRSQARIQKIIASEFVFTIDTPSTAAPMVLAEDAADGATCSRGQMRSRGLFGSLMFPYHAVNTGNNPINGMRLLHGRKHEINTIITSLFPSVHDSFSQPMLQYTTSVRMIVIDGKTGYGKTALLDAITNKLHEIAMRKSMHKFNVYVTCAANGTASGNKVKGGRDVFAFWKHIFYDLIRAIADFASLPLGSSSYADHDECDDEENENEGVKQAYRASLETLINQLPRDIQTSYTLLLHLLNLQEEGFEGDSFSHFQLQALLELMAKILPLFALTMQRVVIIKVDDMHILDTWSLRLLHRLWHQGSGLCFIASINSTLIGLKRVSSQSFECEFSEQNELINADFHFFADLDDQTRFTILDLDPLDSTATVHIAKESGLNDEQARRVYEMSGGNPLYIVELLRALASTSSIGTEHSHRDLLQQQQQQQPGSMSMQENLKENLERNLTNLGSSRRLEEVIYYRLDQLDIAHQLLLKAAAVIVNNGSYFTLDLLSFVLNESDAFSSHSESDRVKPHYQQQDELDLTPPPRSSQIKVHDMLKEMITQRSFIQRRGKRYYEFLVPVEQKTIYNLMIDDQRRSFHHKAAVYYHKQQKQQQQQSMLEEEAFHFQHAKIYHFTFRAWMQAMLQTRQQGHDIQAEGHLQRAGVMLAKWQSESNVFLEPLDNVMRLDRILKSDCMSALLFSSPSDGNRQHDEVKALLESMQSKLSTMWELIDEEYDLLYLLIRYHLELAASLLFQPSNIRSMQAVSQPMNIALTLILALKYLEYFPSQFHSKVDGSKDDYSGSVMSNNRDYFPTVASPSHSQHHHHHQHQQQPLVGSTERCSEVIVKWVSLMNIAGHFMKKSITTPPRSQAVAAVKQQKQEQAKKSGLSLLFTSTDDQQEEEQQQEVEAAHTSLQSIANNLLYDSKLSDLLNTADALHFNSLISLKLIDSPEKLEKLLAIWRPVLTTREYSLVQATQRVVQYGIDLAPYIISTIMQQLSLTKQRQKYDEYVAKLSVILTASSTSSLRSISVAMPGLLSTLMFEAEYDGLVQFKGIYQRCVMERQLQEQELVPREVKDLMSLWMKSFLTLMRPGQHVQDHPEDALTVNVIQAVLQGAEQCYNNEGTRSSTVASFLLRSGCSIPSMSLSVIISAMNMSILNTSANNDGTLDSEELFILWFKRLLDSSSSSILTDQHDSMSSVINIINPLFLLKKMLVNNKVTAAQFSSPAVSDVIKQFFQLQMLWDILTACDHAGHLAGREVLSSLQSYFC